MGVRRVARQRRPTAARTSAAAAGSTRSDGTGRVVKYGGGVEFHSGERYDGAHDRGTTHADPRRASRPGAAAGSSGSGSACDEDQPGAERTGSSSSWSPTAPAGRLPGVSLTIARSAPGRRQRPDRCRRRQHGVEQDADRVLPRTRTTVGSTASRSPGGGSPGSSTGSAVASLAAAAAIPKVPMTVRMSLVGKGTTEMRKSYVLIDWVRNYDLTKGKRTAERRVAHEGARPRLLSRRGRSGIMGACGRRTPSARRG